RRAPGTGGDVSRILMVLPSIAKVNDQSNNLIVRGGNPIENDFYVDNIEIPNINHFPQQGASGGPIGFLNVDFIQDVTFYSGGFSVLYGDRLSSIMDITFREGNSSEVDGQLDLNFSGFGGVAEGPLFGGKGSWLFSARRSYLDFVVDVLDVGSTVAPTYGDIQGKLVYDIDANNKLILLGVFADDHNAPDRETGEENAMAYYGNQDLYQSTVGLNWRSIWGKKGYSNTSIAYTSNMYREDWYETSTGIHGIRNRTREQALKFRNVNRFRLNRKNTVEFGVEAKHVIENYDNWYAETTNDIGNPVPAITIKDEITGSKIGGFLNYVAKPFSRLTTTMGVRVDYFSYNNNTVVSPRFALSFQVTRKTSINASAGIYYQNLPLLLLAQNESNKNLKDAEAIHYVVGIDHLLTENTKLSLEVYQKNYKSFPMDPSQPGLFIIDKSYFGNYGAFEDNGEALSRGVEIMIQKKLAKDFYGLVSASYFRSRYKGLDGVWRDRDFDNRVTFSIQGGYKPNNKWEFSARWIFAGGVPYTPFDLEKSKQYHRAVYDEKRINQVRYPDYHSMNIRFDRRFNFSSSNVVLYLSVWNVYNRKNVANYYWNDKEQVQDEVYQWGLLPIIGIEYEF
ncbi:MAG: TonB-dependent receptor plug domain-containing protein, partial [Chlorobi bacterium]|nr:TonB-dependent receptor plug domain-containing protein [Chlorobiota bacterium]